MAEPNPNPPPDGTQADPPEPSTSPGSGSPQAATNPPAATAEESRTGDEVQDDSPAGAAASPIDAIRKSQETHAAQEQPMLEVHAPHQPIHSWKEFLIHIAAIAVGLLIALGLEQTVEWLHHRHQLTDTRRELSTELDEKEHSLHLEQQQLERIDAELSGDMATLISRRKAHTTTPIKLDYSWQFFGSPEVAWDTARQNGSLSLMPHEELQTYEHIYDISSRMEDAADAFLTQIEITQAIAKRSADGNLSPRDIDELITATSDCQGKLAFTANLLQTEETSLNNTQQ